MGIWGNSKQEYGDNLSLHSLNVSLNSTGRDRGHVFTLTIVMLRLDEKKGGRDDFPKDRNFCKEEKFLGIE